MTNTSASRRDIPDATVARLPVYLRVLRALSGRGVDVVSSDELADAAGVRSAGLRKDLSYLGSYGVRGVGYDVERLSEEITRELGLQSDFAVAIVGMGNLGRALAAYNGCASRGIEVVALLDEDPDVVGRTISGLTVEAMSDLPRVARERAVAIALIATPARSAQAAADAVVAAGIPSILNFAPISLDVPAEVRVRKVDLATEVQILAVHPPQEGRDEVPPLRTAVT